jgi:two-component system OmpR family response regulator
MVDGSAIENFVRPGYQGMSLSSSKMIQPQPRPTARAVLRDASGGASNVHDDQTLAMWPARRAREISPTLPSQLLRDRGAARNGRPVFGTDDGAVVETINRPIHLLVVAHDSVMRHQMIDYLESYTQGVSVATQQEVLRRLAASEPDLIVLDTRLSQARGLDLLRDVRLASDVPLIIVGCHQPDEADRVTALELGADDYLTDPLGMRELVARIRAVLRRSEGRWLAASEQPRRGRCRFGGWQLDRHTRRLTSPAGVPVALTNGEYALLAAFLDAPLRPLTRESLLQATRVHEDVFDRSVDAGVLRLRRKLEANAAAPRLIRTERGIGYVFAVPVEHQ